MGIRGLVPVDAPGIYETVRGLVGLHVADAAAGEVGTQTELLICASGVMPFQPVGVHALSRRMVLGEIQLVKGVQLACDIIFLKNLKAHGTEGVV